MQPLFEAGTPALPSSVRGVVWIIIARSTSSKCPSRRSSGLPPRNSSLPARACATRHSISPYSSAGTEKNATRPASRSNALASRSPIAAPSMPAIWAVWPHACAAPAVLRLHTGGNRIHSSREGHMDVLHAAVSRLPVDSHHVVEAAGIVVLGLVFYSYERRWLESAGRIDRRLRTPLRVMLNGLTF